MNRIATIAERLAIDFSTEEALEEYLKEHPSANSANHRVKPKGEDERRRIYDIHHASADRWMTAEEVRAVCPRCADSMARKGLSRVKRSVLMESNVRKAQWDDLPKGWTEASLKEFWGSLTGERVHKVTACIKKMEGTEIDDPGAFCASLADRIEGKGWRSER